jgi:N-acyl-D-amino-acid deacylase
MRRSGLSLRALLSVLVLMALSAVSIAAPRPRVDASYDIVIANGKIIDGSGNPWFYANVAIKNGRIVKIGNIDPKLGKKTD